MVTADVVRLLTGDVVIGIAVVVALESGFPLLIVVRMTGVDDPVEIVVVINVVDGVVSSITFVVVSEKTVVNQNSLKMSILPESLSEIYSFLLEAIRYHFYVCSILKQRQCLTF